MTLGDPRGVGPEVVRGALGPFLEGCGKAELVVLGPGSLLPPEGARVRTEETGGFDGSEESAGNAALNALRRGVSLALEGRVSALVTAPVSKPALHAAGVEAPGQTELLGELTGAERTGMLMCAEETRPGPPLRVLLATTHLPLREVPRILTADLLVEQILLLDRALRTGWKIEAPRIAVCGLNPHASDGGLFGDEEERIFAPALERLREAGVGAEGPFPADTVFLRALDGRADAVAVPYHDLGMAPFKTLAFGRGVNVTLGLPFPRTSPDHGTAFDLAGTGRADPSSTLEALRLAARLADGSVREGAP